MTLTIIFALVIIVGVILCIFEDKIAGGLEFWPIVMGTTLAIVFGIALIINLAIWIPSKGDSEITYHQMLQEKATIEQMIGTDKDVDRLLLNDRVINYNSRVVKMKTNSQRFIFRDYYSNDVNWDALEFINWVSPQ